MSAALRYVDHCLRFLGHVIADLWCIAAALFVLLGFCASGVLASLAVGILARDMLGGGGFVVIAVAFAFGLFLAVYAWEPHVKARVMKAFDAIKPAK